ncbi:MAG: hypothetical protein GKR91_07320 [Pseudomonadales bacterium]|nr:hypothetical protein [Pseudomonadales bacterium]
MSILDKAKELANLIKELGETDLYRKTVELEADIVDLTGENRALKEKIDELEKHSSIIDNLTFDPPFYVGGEKSDIYCSHCIEVHSLPVHLVKVAKSEIKPKIYSCPMCNNEYTDARDNGT